MSRADSSALADFDVPHAVQQGTQLLKVSAKKVKTQTFRIDQDQGQILWESKKSGIGAPRLACVAPHDCALTQRTAVPIEAIKEIRTGVDARNYREQFKIAADAEERWLTIVYIVDNKYKTLHLVAPTKDVFAMWEVSLRVLHAERAQLMDGLDHEELRQKLWERQHWRGADIQGDQKLDIGEVENLCRRLNIFSSREDIEHRFKDADVQGRGYLDFTDFQRFVKLLKRRPEIDRLFMKISNEDEKFDFPDFEKFMREKQKVRAVVLYYMRLHAVQVRPQSSRAAAHLRQVRRHDRRRPRCHVASAITVQTARARANGRHASPRCQGPSLRAAA